MIDQWEPPSMGQLIWTAAMSALAVLLLAAICMAGLALHFGMLNHLLDLLYER